MPRHLSVDDNMEKAKKNNARQTIVIVSFINPLPASQGNRRVICSLISWLRNNGFYVIFVLQAMNIPREMRGELESMVDELYVVGDVITAGSGKDESIKNTFIGLLKSFFWNLAYSKKNIVLRIFPDALIQRLSSALTQQIKPRNPRDCWPETISEVQSISGKYDPIAVISEYIYMTPCFEKLPKSILKLTHTHDMLSRVAEEIGAYGVDTQDRECRPDEERKALLRGDVVIALQANEARMFKELVPEREVIIVPYSGKHIVSRPSKVVVPNRILMVAANHPMNRRGLGLFCSEVWPIVMEAISDAQLRIVGGVSDALPTGTPNAESMGIVDDVAVEYKNASVIINPVDLGTGLKIKTVEALCYGKALVTTYIGVEGLLFGDSPPCVVTDDWYGFAKAVICLLTDDKLRRDIEERAISYANANFKSDIVYSELQSTLLEHIIKHNSFQT